MADTDLQAYVTAPIIDLSNQLQKRIKAERGVDIPAPLITSFISDFADILQNYKALDLSKIRPDFEQIKQQFIAHLRQKDSWRDLIQAGVGETLLEFVAAVGDYGQTSIQRAYQETTLDARLTSSVFTLMRTLGVHLDRKVPAQVEVLLYGDTTSSLSELAIPALSQFNVGGASFFNRDPIVFNNNTETNPLVTTLYQGIIRTESFLSFGTPFQSVEIGEEDYRVSDTDIYVFLDGNDEYKRVIDGLWHYPKSAKVFYENTTPLGNVELLFGNGVYAKVPPVEKTIAVVYALTEGSGVNGSGIDKTITLVDTNEVVPSRIKTIRGSQTITAESIKTRIRKEVKGVAVSSVFNGGDEKDKEFYRAVGPGIRASKGRMVTRPDHYALGLDFPNVADVLFQGQKELAPGRPSYANVVGVTVLTTSGLPFTNDEWKAYTKYLSSLEIWRVEFLRIDPKPVVIDVSANVFAVRSSDIVNLDAYLTYNVTEFFRIKRGSLGKSIYENDIEDLMKFEYGNIRVDYATDVLPNKDFILTRTQYPVLGTCKIKPDYSSRTYVPVPPRIT